MRIAAKRGPKTITAPTSTTAPTLESTPPAPIDEVANINAVVEDVEDANGDSAIPEVASPEAPAANDVPDAAVASSAEAEMPVRSYEPQHVPDLDPNALGSRGSLLPRMGTVVKHESLGPSTFGPQHYTAEAIARTAVERVLAEQAEAARFDVIEGNRVVITLRSDDLEAYRSHWNAFNASTTGDRVTFSEYLSLRLRRCRTHTAAREIYVGDSIRQSIEQLFDSSIMSEQDLLNKIDRHIRPIIESPDVTDGILRLRPLDPMLLELLTSWEPDKTPAEAVGDFMHTAALEKAGII